MPKTKATKGESNLKLHSTRFRGMVVYPELNRNQTQPIGMTSIPSKSILSMMRSIIVAFRESLFHGKLPINTTTYVTTKAFSTIITVIVENSRSTGVSFYRSFDMPIREIECFKNIEKAIGDLIFHLYGRKCRVIVSENNFSITFIDNRSTYDFVYNMTHSHPICKCIGIGGAHVDDECEKPWMKLFGLID